jgi:protein-glutamine gamma-glutamyltransferase
MFSTREGFCEHYASAFAFLMRAVGIPTRVVVGYQGAEYNPYENYMMVYQYNAHAWNEVWIEGQGWVRYDPTGAVSPLRIEQGVEAALRDDPAFMDEFAMRFGVLSWLNTLRLRFDALEYEWNRRVVNYNEDDQFELFQELFGDVTESKVLLLLMLMASVVIIAIGFTVIRIDLNPNRDPVVKLYMAIGKELERIGLARNKGEGPLNYRDRVIAQRPELEQIMTKITERYVKLSYNAKFPSESQKKSQLKEFRSMVSQLRFQLSPFAKVGRNA